MAERESSKSYHSTSRARTRRTKTSGVSTEKVRIGFLFGMYFAVLCLIMGLSRTPVSLKPGEPAPYDIRARVSFRYLDEALTDAARKTAMGTEPGTYTMKPGWLEEVTATLRKILKTVKDARTEEEASRRLAEEAIDVVVMPLWRLKSERGAAVLDDMEAKTAGILVELGENGIMDDLQYTDELSNGRSFIRVTENGGSRTVLLGRDIGISGTRQVLAQRIDSVLSDYPTEVIFIVKSRQMAEIVPNLEYSAEETAKQRQAAAERIKQIYTQVSKGEILAYKGVILNPITYKKVMEERSAYQKGRTWYQVLMEIGGLVFVTAALLTVAVMVIRRSEPSRKLTVRRWMVLGFLFLVALTGARLVSTYLHRENLAPLGLIALPVGMIFSLTTAITIIVVGTILITVGVGADLGYAVSMATATMVGVLLIRDVRRRSSILQTGAVMGAVWFMAYVAYRFLGSQETMLPVLQEASFGLANGLVSGAVIAGLMPFIEYAFQATTNISLLELSDQNHPALRDLLVRAAGTYHHSLIVGNIAEAACRSVGADPLLARVASYYHDIGKMTKPEYFVENQPPGRSPHDGLSPSMSALVIISHVKDGADLAREYNLPGVIVDVIRQHHGTTLVEFFFRRAQETGEDKDKNMSERLFHYPGPLPESREAAIVMVADSVEAASRSLSDPSPTHIDNLVGTIIQRRLMEGQFDESGLSFRDLTTVRVAISRILVSMFHSRPKYPGQKED
ncbi:MAG: HDIG domain-containing protein [Planctomycetes bacterium]|nr:HDIG domain-containing protein [Planctomycetota bacterium]